MPDIGHPTDDHPSGVLPFEVSATPTPVQRLLLLADQYVQHNDALDRSLLPGSNADPEAHVSSAGELAAATHAAIRVITDERLPSSAGLSTVMARLRQLSYLSSGAGAHRPRLARELTALAPEAAVDSAALLAAEIRRRRPQASGEGGRLTAPQHSALREIARGHIATTNSLAHRYVRHLDVPVAISTVRSLEAEGLADRIPNSAPAAYRNGPLQDRIRLTAAGTVRLAAVIDLPPPAPTPVAAHPVRSGPSRHR
ncbi:hypothetical protein [Actinacidiphila sp. bgisy144]|uniref:hypothetical protein n=1 Tax=Actinacidiphila sp. bgisy144 TaxID=3413791 RepID=UPI003EB9AB9A